MAPMALSSEEIERYARHLVLREVGGPGQARLKAGRVLVIGAGVLGALAGVMGSLMAMEVIRALADFGEPLVGRLLMVDARSMRFETLGYAWDPDNPLNGAGVKTGPEAAPAEPSLRLR